MLSKAFFLPVALGAALAAAPVAAGQASQETESVGENQTATVGANQSETTKHEAAKNAVNNIRAAIQEMEAQEQILRRLVADESAPRAAYTKFKAEGTPVRAQADTEETKEGGLSTVTHKMPARTKSAEEPAGDDAPGQLTATSRAECRNNLKQLSLDIDRSYDKLHRLSRQTKQKTFLMELEQLQTENRRVRAALKKLPDRPDEEADRAALAAISEAIEKTKAAVDKLGRVKVQF